LVGFVLKLHLSKKKEETKLPEEDIEFYGLNESKTGFHSPIDTVVMKFAVLHKDDETALPLYQSSRQIEKRENNIYKETDTVENYKREAYLQSKIYQHTASKGEPVCPALIDLSCISDLDAIRTLLDLILTKCKDDESKRIVQYLKAILVRSDLTENMYMDDVQLGIITMESAAEYKTVADVLADLWKKSRGDEAAHLRKKVEIYEQMLAQVLRLYNETHLIHTDFHVRNCLLKLNEPASNDMPYQVYMIDFGKMIGVDNLSQQELKAAQDYAKYKFKRDDLFVSNKKPNELKIAPNLLVKHDNFDRNLCENMLLLICAFEYVAEQTRIRNIYETLDPESTSLDKIAKILNDYYKMQGVYIQRFDHYNILNPNDPNTTYNRTLQDIQGKNYRPPITTDNTGSPTRLIQVRKAAMPVENERKRKQTSSPKQSLLQSDSTEGSSGSSPSFFKLNRLRFLDSGSGSGSGSDMNTSFPNAVNSFSPVNYRVYGGQTRKRKRQNLLRTKNRVKMSTRKIWR
jgi:hypothetical protein